MKIVTTTYKCDRCKKEIDIKRKGKPHTITIDKSEQSTDLCDRCMDSFYEWFCNKPNEKEESVKD